MGTLRRSCPLSRVAGECWGTGSGGFLIHVSGFVSGGHTAGSWAGGKSLAPRPRRDRRGEGAGEPALRSRGALGGRPPSRQARRARERGLGFRLEGRLPARYAPIGEGLTSILGHLLENALEAAQSAVGCRFLKVPTTDRAFPREKKPFFFPGTGLRPRPWPGRRRGSSIPPRD